MILPDQKLGLQAYDDKVVLHQQQNANLSPAIAPTALTSHRLSPPFLTLANGRIQVHVLPSLSLSLSHQPLLGLRPCPIPTPSPPLGFSRATSSTLSRRDPYLPNQLEPPLPICLPSTLIQKPHYPTTQYCKRLFFHKTHPRSLGRSAQAASVALALSLGLEYRAMKTFTMRQKMEERKKKQERLGNYATGLAASWSCEEAGRMTAG